MLVAMMLWFASFHLVMTSDKFTYLFGRAIPALSLVLTMVLRLVPSYRRKADALMTARACIGKGPAEGASVAALSGLCNRYGSQSNLAGSIESFR